MSAARRVVITGAASGIGRAIAARLANEGWTVCGVDRRWPDGAGADDHVFDLAELAAIPTLAATLGSVDALIHCAGVAAVGSFAEDDPASWRTLIDVNLLAPIALTHALLPAMIGRDGGQIVTITSESARVGAAGEAVYSATKGGLAAFVRSLAQEVGRNGITVNAVSPGPVRTTLSEGRADLLDRLARKTPLARIAEAEDVAGAVAWLLGADARFVTGQTISVSGGLTMLP